MNAQSLRNAEYRAGLVPFPTQSPLYPWDEPPLGFVQGEYKGYVYRVGPVDGPGTGIKWIIPGRGHGGYQSQGAWYTEFKTDNPMTLAEAAVRRFIDKLGQ
jgi:hypothetical protein